MKFWRGLRPRGFNLPLGFSLEDIEGESCRSFGLAEDNPEDEATAEWGEDSDRRDDD